MRGLCIRLLSWLLLKLDPARPIPPALIWAEARRVVQVTAQLDHTSSFKRAAAMKMLQRDLPPHTSRRAIALAIELAVQELP